MFARQGVYTREEAIARADIRLENYTKIINIEALTMIEMARRDIIPAVSDFVADLCQNVAAKQAVCDKIPFETEKNLIARLAELNDGTSAAVTKLENDLKAIDKSNVLEASHAMAHTHILQHLFAVVAQLLVGDEDDRSLGLRASTDGKTWTLRAHEHIRSAHDVMVVHP